MKTLELNKVYQGNTLDVLKTFPDESVQCVVTSPPYWGLRDYGVEGQIGLEKTPEEYVENMVEVFREVKRVLKKDGTLWLNLGDSYASNGVYIKSWSENHPEKKHLHTENKERYGDDKKGFRGGEYNIKAKDLIGIPFRVAFALQADGWWLRQDIIWNKPNPMPESVTDRCTKSHEYIFLLAKSQKYYFDSGAVREPNANPQRTNYTPGSRIYGENKNHNDNDFAQRQQQKICLPSGRNKRSVWTISTKPYKEAHFAVFPPKIPELCIKAGSKEGDTVLDPFIGSGTTAEVAINLDRNWVGIDLNPEYIELANKRLKPTITEKKTRDKGKEFWE